jgi:hypothetical protein
MARIFYLTILLLFAGTVGVWAQEKLGPDGFPADWKPQDFLVGKAAGAASATASALEGATPGVVPYAIPLPSEVKPVSTGKPHKMVQMRVDQMKSVSLVPSGSTVIPIPPPGPNDRRVSSTNPALVLGTEETVSASDNILGNLQEAPAPLAEAKLGVPADTWQVLPQTEWEARLPITLSRGVQSPALKAAWQRLLLADTKAPDAKGAKRNWVAVKADALESLGLYEAAWQLWKSVPAAQRKKISELDYGWAEVSLLSGNPNEACPTARDRTTKEGPQSKWPVLVAVCQLLQPHVEGNVAGSGLSLQLIAPDLQKKNPALLRVLDAVHEGKRVGPQSGGPLGGAVLAAYPALIGSSTLAGMPDMALRRIAGSSALPGDLRAASALALANQTGSLADGATAWALVSNTVLAVQPDAVVLAHAASATAPLLVPAALRMGDVSAAEGPLPLWKPDAKPGKNVNLQAQASLLLAARKGTLVDADWARWLAEMPVENTLVMQAALRTMMGLEGMGVDVPANLWGKLKQRNSTPIAGADPVWERLMADAARDRNVARVVALATEGLGGRPASEAPAGVVGAVAKAFHATGQDDLGWRIVAESVLPAPSLHNLFPRPMPEEMAAPGNILAVPTPAEVEVQKVAAPHAPVVKKPTVKKPVVRHPSAKVKKAP